MHDESVTKPESGETFDLKSLSVDGEHAPSVEELTEGLSKLDLSHLLYEGKVNKITSSGLSLSFKTISQSHLMVLMLGVKGAKRGLFYFSPADDLFKDKPIEDYRLDGGQLSVGESLQKEGDATLNVTLRNTQSEPADIKTSYSSLIKDTVTEVMPHLKESVSTLEIS